MARREYPWEAFIWIAGIAVVAISDPSVDFDFTLCLFKLIGFENCPGCGLGHAIGYLFRGELLQSFEAHVLGMPALIALVGRIVHLLYLHVEAK